MLRPTKNVRWRCVRGWVIPSLTAIASLVFFTETCARPPEDEDTAKSSAPATDPERPVAIRLIARGEEFFVHEMGCGKPALLANIKLHSSTEEALSRRPYGRSSPTIQMRPTFGGVFHTQLATARRQCLEQSWQATYGPVDLG